MYLVFTRMPVESYRRQLQATFAVVRFTLVGCFMFFSSFLNFLLDLYIHIHHAYIPVTKSAQSVHRKPQQAIGWPCLANRNEKTTVSHRFILATSVTMRICCLRVTPG